MKTPLGSGRRSFLSFSVFATTNESTALGLNSTPAVLYVTGDGTSAGDLLDSVTRAADGAQVYTADDIVAIRAANGQSGVSATSAPHPGCDIGLHGV